MEINSMSMFLIAISSYVELISTTLITLLTKIVIWLNYVILQLHVAELNDGYDWGRLNLRSVTEQSSFDEFLSTAQLAGTEFQVNHFVQ